MVRRREDKIDPLYVGVGKMTAKFYMYICACERSSCFWKGMSVTGMKSLFSKAYGADVIS